MTQKPKAQRFSQEVWKAYVFLPLIDESQECCCIESFASSLCQLPASILENRKPLTTDLRKGVRCAVTSSTGRVAGSYKKPPFRMTITSRFSTIYTWLRLLPNASCFRSSFSIQSVTANFLVVSSIQKQPGIGGTCFGEVLAIWPFSTSTISIDKLSTLFHTNCLLQSLSWRIARWRRWSKTK